MPIVNQGWAYINATSSTTAPGGFDQDIQFNHHGAFSGSGLLITDGTGSLSASVNISASAFYGDGTNLTGLTASAVNVADGPEFAIQFRKDSPVTGEISGSGDLMWITSSTDYLQVTGAIKVAGFISASTSVSASEFYVAGNTIYFGAGNTYKIGRNGTNLDINAGDSIVLNAGSGHVSASTNFSASAFYTAGDIFLGDDQAIYFEDDLGTYIESDTTDRLRFVVGGNQMLLLDEDEDRVNIGFGNKLAVGLGNNSTPDATVHVSGTTGGLFLVEGSPYGQVLGVSGSGLVTITGSLETIGDISASTAISASEYYIQGGNSFFFGSGNTHKITRNGTNLDVNSGGNVILNAGSGHVSASTNFSASAFYGIDAYLTRDLNVCEGTASIAHLSGCAALPITVHSPMSSSYVMSASAFYANGVELAAGGGGGIFTEINATQAATTSSVAIGKATAPEGVFQVSGSLETGGNALVKVSGDGGNDIFVVTGSGRVGIGTAAPSRQLDLQGTSAAYMEFNATSHRRYTIGSEGSGFIIFDDTEGGTPGYRLCISDIDATLGYVGIGKGLLSPKAQLHVSSSLDVSNNGVFRVDGDASESILFVTGSGRVGINTGSPSYMLHVSGTNTTARAVIASDSAVIDITPGSGPAIKFGTPADTDAYQVFGTFSSRHQIKLNSNLDFQISGALGGVGYYFDQSEKTVGIGTSTPTATLTVAGSGSFSGSEASGHDLYFGSGTNRTLGTSLQDGDDYLVLAHTAGGIDVSASEGVTLITAPGGNISAYSAGDFNFQVADANMNMVFKATSEGNVTISSSADNMLLQAFGTRGAASVLAVTGAQGVGINTSSPRVALDVHYSGNLNPTNLGDDKGGGEVVYFGTAGGDLAAGGLYYLDTDGAWKSTNASVTGSGHDQLLGVAMADGKPAAVGMLVKGYFHQDSYFSGSFGVGKPVYIQSSSVARSATEGGFMSGAAPTSGSSYVRVIGYGTSTANVIYFNPDATYVEIG